MRKEKKLKLQWDTPAVRENITKRNKKMGEELFSKGIISTAPSKLRCHIVKDKMS